MYIFIFLHTYTWNLNDPCFERKRPSFGGFKPQNRGQAGSRYMRDNYIDTLWNSWPQNLR